MPFLCFRDSIDFGQRQLCISEELDSPNMRAEAYLNLARAHERLGALDKALAFARHRYSFYITIIFILDTCIKRLLQFRKADENK